MRYLEKIQRAHKTTQTLTVIYKYITEPSASAMITLLFLVLTTLAHMATSNDHAPHDRGVYVLFGLKAIPTEIDTVTGYYGLLSDLVKKQPGFISETPFVSIEQSFQQTLYVRFDNDKNMHAWKNFLYTFKSRLMHVRRDLWIIV